MKSKKIISAVCALALSASMLGGTLAGCKKKCEHAYRWTEEVAATCTAAGKQRGVCGICGDVTEQPIEIDASKHAYGEWQVTAPTEAAAGSAERICTHNAEHKQTITLPAFTENDAGYKSTEVTKQPTALEDGIKKVVIEQDGEEYTFDVKLEKRKIETVADAVLVASSLGGNIRKTEGTYSTSESKGDVSSFKVEFGDDYTHIVDDGEQTETWYSFDENGDPFGVFVQKIAYDDSQAPDTGDEETPGSGGPTVDADIKYKYSEPMSVPVAVKENLLGLGYASGGNTQRTYGAEHTLETYYKMAKYADVNNRAVKYDEGFEKVNDEVSFWFSFSLAEGSFFCRYRVEANLYPSGEIKSMSIRTRIIRNYMIATDAEGTLLFDADGDAIFAEQYERDGQLNDLYEYETDADGNLTVKYDGVKTDANGNVLHDRNGNEIPRPMPKVGTTTGWYSDDHPEVSVRNLIYTKQTLKTPSDEVPDNPYDSNVLYISSFDVSLGNVQVGDTAIAADSNKAVVFNVSNVKPLTAKLNYDPTEIYLRTSTKDIKLTMNYGDNSYGIIGFTSGANITVNSRYAGEVTFVVKTRGGRFEKEFKVNFKKGAASSLMPSAYVYSDAGGEVRYDWTDRTDSQDAALPLYTEQTLLIKAVAPKDEAAFADTSFIASVTRNSSSVSAAIAKVTLSVAEDGTPVGTFVATQPGLYRVNMRYTAGSGSRPSAFFYINVTDKPTVGLLFKADYTAHLSSVLIGGEPKSATLKASFTFPTVWYEGTLDIDVDGNATKYTFVVDRATNAVTLTYVSGYQGETFDFTVAVNEAYKLVITHSTGFGDIKESVVLAKVEEQT